MSELLSIYTPSNLSPEILEEIFVQRHKLLEKSVQWVEESILTKKKNHLLFIGSRGSGKTHLTSMIINRLKQNSVLDDKMVLVWLGEDDVITNFLDFVLSILRSMAREEGFNDSCLEHAIGKSHNEAVNIILDSITEQIGDKMLLVVKENMSDVFSGLKDDGQKRLRAFMQEKKNMVILGTSQQLFEGVSSRDAAFFGFFDIHHLKPLSVDDAMELIAKVSKLKGDTALHDFIYTSAGRYRVRALHHLAGGNQRLYMNLLEFLTVDTLDNLVSALNKLADDLTPYFQERIKSLPPQQGKIVQKLCDIEGALPVKSIAQELFIDERSVAKQLGELKKKYYVIGHKRGKQTYYEIAEPLMRLSLEVKHNHGKPLKMLVLLLRAWFSDKELRTQLFDSMGVISFSYIAEALVSDKKIINTLCESIEEELNQYMENEDHQNVIRCANELLASPDESLYDKCEILIARCVAHGINREFNLAIKDASTVIDIEVSDVNQKARALAIRAYVNIRLKVDFNIVLEDLLSALNFKGISKYTELSVKQLLLPIYYHFHKYEKAHETFKSVFKLNKLLGNKKLYFVKDIIHSVAEYNASAWEKEIKFLLTIFDKYQSMEYLGIGLIESIEVFANDEDLLPHFQKWQKLWQKEGEKYEFMQISLKSLEVSQQAIEAKNDKPLFALPKEVRDLVVPLLEGVIE